MYEDKIGTLKQCNASGEDPTCIDQWSAIQQNVSDHLTYLGQNLDCGSTAVILENYENGCCPT